MGDDFGFPIVRMTYATNNMPPRIFDSTFMSELLRIVKCFSGISEFEECASKLITRMYDQKAKIVKIRKALINLYNNHLSTFNKFYASSLSFCKCTVIS